MELRSVLELRLFFLGPDSQKMSKASGDSHHIGYSVQLRRARLEKSATFPLRVRRRDMRWHQVRFDVSGIENSARSSIEDGERAALAGAASGRG